MRFGDASGCTLVEVMVALFVFAVGLLGLAAEAGLLTRQLGATRRFSYATSSVAARLEALRATACRSPTNGAERVSRGSATLAELRWDWTGPADSIIQARVVLAPTVAPRRPDTLTATASCGR
ncbi:MAG TPA: prepilin-type N-terminal cleavage/methylation domain-containing protein [Gemmatimonadales bacterium]|nr:prepilin-type N-terminal cleavage/methylation domain-containing protein [Gemmatimonadales bacterium]